MKVYLMQHGEAAAEDTDPRRPLTEKGREEVGKVASFLKEAGIRMDAIWHSGKTRAVETAAVVATLAGYGAISSAQEGLNPTDPVYLGLDRIKKLSAEGKTGAVLIVGHLPYLAKLASSLLTGYPTGDFIAFRQGGVLCLEEKGANLWAIQWAVTPDLF